MHYFEILRGRANLGNFTLKGEFRFAELEPSDLKFPHKVIKPDEVLEAVTKRLNSISNIIETNKTDETCPDFFMISRDDTSSEISLDPDATAEPLNRTSNDNSEFPRPQQFLNLNVTAEQLVMSGDVKHIPEMECFIVKGSDDKKY